LTTSKYISSYFEGSCQTSQIHDLMTAGETKLIFLFVKKFKIIVFLN
jgi:hypothetical protein